MKAMNANCTGMENRLADLLLDPAAVPAKVQTHVDGCNRCQAELKELRATMALLDTWESPEPSPYFLTRLDARMRAEREAEPAGLISRWYARITDRMAYGPATHVRPLAAMALTIVLLLGGGTYLGITDWDQTAVPQGAASVVSDLQTLDSNAQLLDQLETISSTNDNGD